MSGTVIGIMIVLCVAVLVLGAWLISAESSVHKLKHSLAVAQRKPGISRVVWRKTKSKTLGEYDHEYAWIQVLHNGQKVWVRFTEKQMVAAHRIGMRNLEDIKDLD